MSELLSTSMKTLFILGMAILLCGCASQSSSPSAAGNGDTNTQAKYAGLSNQQLEFRRAQLRRDLNREFINGSTQGSIPIDQMDRDEEQRQLEDMEAELLRRDPSGDLIQKSNSMSAYPN